MKLYGAPHVAHPLSVKKFKQNPCTLISPSQTQELKSTLKLSETPNVVSTRGVSRACDWVTVGPSANIGILEGGYGLSTVYANRNNYAVFQPVAPIEGYPAVHQSPGKEFDNCTLIVGVADRQAISVSYTPDDSGVNDCDGARQLATAVIDTLKNEGQ